MAFVLFIVNNLFVYDVVIVFIFVYKFMEIFYSYLVFISIFMDMLLFAYPDYVQFFSIFLVFYCFLLWVLYRGNLEDGLRYPPEIL